MAVNRRKTDYGTVLLHTLLVISFIILTATGLRIGTDDPETAWLVNLDPILPTEHLWFRHLVAGAILTAVMAGYFWYVWQARLLQRVRLDRSRIASMLGPAPQQFAAIGVLAYWVLIIGLVVEVVTGIVVFAGGGRLMLTLHRDAMFVCLGAVVAHVGLHALHGGWPQLLRIVTPGPLNLAPPPPDLAELLAEQIARNTPQNRPAPGEQAPKAGSLQANPVVTAAIVGVTVLGLGAAAEHTTRPVLRVVEIDNSSAPRLDGDLSDPAWARAKPAEVLTTQGGDFGGSFQSRVEVRALHDTDFVYFSFVWDDPTRSLIHLPLVKRDGAWRVAASRGDLADESRFNEDKFAVLLTPAGLPLIGAAIHLARAPLPDKPGSTTGRGLHFTAGGVADVWLWRASHEGPHGHIDNCHFGGPKPKDGHGANHYAGGFATDPEVELPHVSNAVAVGRADDMAVVPRRLPRDLAAMRAAMGRISDEPGHSESEGARWWMGVGESEPYSADRDAQFPNGTVLPEIVFGDDTTASRNSIRGMARWAAGRWTLELARRINTGSRHDVAIKTGALMWVGAFDHSAKRHTRHLRPFSLEVD